MELSATRLLTTRTILGTLFACILTGCFHPPTPLGADQLAAREQEILARLRRGTIALQEGHLATLSTALLLAEREFQIAYQLDSKDVRVLDALGCVRYLEGRTSEAEGFFRAAILGNSQFDRAYEHLGVLLLSTGRTDAGREFLRLAVVLNPLNDRARTKALASE